MFKGSKKTQYFGEQMKLNGKIWDVFQSKLVKSCSFFGTFNGLMAEKSLATLKISFFLRSVPLAISTRYMVIKVNWFSSISSAQYNVYDLICSVGSWDIKLQNYRFLFKNKSNDKKGLVSTTLIIIVPYFGIYASIIFIKKYNFLLNTLICCIFKVWTEFSEKNSLISKIFILFPRNILWPGTIFFSTSEY